MGTVVVYQSGRYAVARFGVAGGPAGPAATKRFAIRLESATSKDIVWVSGAITLTSLTMCLVTDAGNSSVTVSVNGSAVGAWEDQTPATVPATYTASPAVTLANGDVLAITWTGPGAGLSLGFSE